MDSRAEVSAASREPLSSEDSFHHCFFYFVKGLEVLTLDAAAQCDVMGNFHVAREIQHDVLDPGTSLTTWPGEYLNQSEKEAITAVVDILKELPEDALQVHHFQAMSHPAWVAVRSAAVALISHLAAASEKTAAFGYGFRRA